MEDPEETNSIWYPVWSPQRFLPPWVDGFLVALLPKSWQEARAEQNAGERREPSYFLIGNRPNLHRHFRGWVCSLKSLCRDPSRSHRQLARSRNEGMHCLGPLLWFDETWYWTSAVNCSKYRDIASYKVEPGHLSGVISKWCQHGLWRSRIRSSDRSCPNEDSYYLHEECKPKFDIVVETGRLVRIWLPGQSRTCGGTSIARPFRTVRKASDVNWLEIVLEWLEPKEDIVRFWLAVARWVRIFACIGRCNARCCVLPGLGNLRIASKNPRRLLRIN